MADHCNTSNYFLRDTNSKLAILLPQTNVKKNSFFWSSPLEWRLPIYWPAAGEVPGFWGLAANNSSGDVHGAYLKQTKALSLIWFCDKDKLKVRFWRRWFLNRLYNSKRLEHVIFVDERPWTRGRRRRCAVYMCGLPTNISKISWVNLVFIFNLFLCPLLLNSVWKIKMD